MAKTSDVSDCELLSWTDALGGEREIARARLFDGGAIVHARPMLWPCPLEQIEAPHAAGAVVEDVDVHFVRKGLIGGAGGQPFKDGSYLHARSSYPGYLKFWVDSGLDAEHWAFDPSRLEKKRVKRGFALLHFNLIWGHWLTEMFPKLFAVRILNARGVHAPLVLPSTAPEYMLRIIEDVLPGQPLVVYDSDTECVELQQLILPPMLHQWYVFHPHFGEALDAYSAPTETTRSSSRLFVSRAGMRTAYAYREMVNEPQIEAVAAELGFQVVRPETLPWREQLALFAGAGVIAGEFGSGLHNAIFARPGTKVVALNWIVDVQSRIANFREQDIGYVLPDDGQPRGYSLERPMQRFRIDPAELRDKLLMAIESAEAAR